MDGGGPGLRPTESKTIMFRSWKLGTAFGIGIYVHWSFFLLPAWVLLSNLELGGWLIAGYAVAVILAVFGCVVLHELGHALAARRFGIPTRDITLYPIGGVARLERMSEKPWEEFCIAVAGPAVNVLIAGLLGGFFLLKGLVTPPVPLPPLGLMFLNHLMYINLFLAAFNLLPAFPMDGGRVLRALLAARMGTLRATQAAVNVAIVMAVLMVVAGIAVLHSPALILVAAFVYLAGQQELAAVYQREMRRRDEEYGSPWQAYSQRGTPFWGAYSQRPAAEAHPNLTVYLWDEKAGIWVPQKPLRPLGN
jgi:Zn-dependent protease